MGPWGVGAETAREARIAIPPLDGGGFSPDGFLIRPQLFPSYFTSDKIILRFEALAARYHGWHGAGLGKCNVFAAGIFNDVRRYARLTQGNQRTHMLHFAQVAFLGGSILLGFYVAGFRVILGGLGPAQSQDCADLWPGRPARIRQSINFSH